MSASRSPRSFWERSGRRRLLLDPLSQGSQSFGGRGRDVDLEGDGDRCDPVARLSFLPRGTHPIPASGRFSRGRCRSNSRANGIPLPSHRPVTASVPTRPTSRKIRGSRRVFQSVGGSTRAFPPHAPVDQSSPPSAIAERGLDHRGPPSSASTTSLLRAKSVLGAVTVGRWHTAHKHRAGSAIMEIPLVEVEERAAVSVRFEPGIPP